MFRFLNDPSFQELYGINVLSFEDINVRNSYKRYFIPLVEIKDYNVMIDGRNSFDQLLQNNLRKMIILQLVTMMITQLCVCYIIPISKNVIN